MTKKTSVPDNWDNVAKMGTLIGTSRFLPLRVPLDDTYVHKLQSIPDEIWTPRDFLEVQESKELNVKMIIDLTNTHKYYNGESEFHDSGVKYVKLSIEGFAGPPSAKDVDRFTKIADDFFKKESEGVIAVHCTHGLNRTGYLIVDYLVKRMKCTVTEALETFKLARPPGIIKYMYVEELYKRLGANEQVQLPELPAWADAKYSIRMKPRKEGKKPHKNEKKPRGRGKLYWKQNKKAKA